MLRWLHGMVVMVAWLDGGCGGHGRVTEVAVVVLHCVVVAAWCGGHGRGRMA